VEYNCLSVSTDNVFCFYLKWNDLCEKKVISTCIPYHQEPLLHILAAYISPYLWSGFQIPRYVPGE